MYILRLLHTVIIFFILTMSAFYSYTLTHGEGIPKYILCLPGVAQLVQYLVTYPNKVQITLAQNYKRVQKDAKIQNFTKVN